MPIVKKIILASECDYIIVITPFFVLQQDPRGNHPVDNVRMTELVDASLKCTTNFAKEPIYNDVIRDIESIRLFKNILLHFAGDNKGPTETLLRLTIMIIEIIASSDLDGAFIIHQENIEQDVIRLANHSNQKIGRYLNQ